MTKANEKNKKTTGYAVLELLFYISFFTVLSLVVINSMIIMAGAFRETATQAELLIGGSIMEKISREIRQAHEISSISANSLKLNTKDDTGTDKTVEFLLSEGNVQLLENDIFTGNLNTPNITVTEISFIQITSTMGKAVKIYLAIRSDNDTFNRVVDFYNTVALRGDY